ncbi:hypothetical protein [Archangium sp.]|uniref:hypothetical protein n=1 Tax=Archangium sp. TaxID=1872627 RepID=UPI002D5FC32D|nr:hypothetical protein [Archangium sp.]HYO54845.1 hypothetical protein [Archangium sp.]
MRFPSKMATWLCICALGFEMQAHAEDESPEWQLPSYLDEVRDEEMYDDDDDDDDALCGPAVTERRQILGDVFEYSYRVRVGYGAHDFITLHRVVREVTPWVSARAPKSVFLVHGDAWGFRSAFLSSVASGAVPRQQSLAVFLAQRGVDVWGIDLRWVHVPRETTDFSFMKSWNLGLHARDVGTGMRLARDVRECKGLGSGRMVLLGWSRGATIAYAYLNGETQLSLWKHQVSGFIPVDMAYVFAPGDVVERQAACQTHAVLAQFQAAGQYEGGMLGLQLQYLGGLAITQPDAGTSGLPGYTNREAALLFGAATSAFQKPPIIPDYHWTGGQFGAAGPPTGLTWTRERFFFDGLVQSSPYQSIGEQVDTLAMWCGAPDVPYDDHLKQVTVPVLYVGAAGGVGRYGLHSLSLLGSTDVSTHVVQRFPDTARALDYGHADLFLADDAETAVWTPILEWLQRH